MIDRDKILADLSAYLDGELGPAQVQRVEKAVAGDQAVEAELAALRRTRELVRGLERVRPGPDFVAGVLEKAERFRLRAPAHERPQDGMPVFRLVAVAAVILVAMGVCVAVISMLYTAPVPDGQGRIASAPGRAAPSGPESPCDRLHGLPCDRALAGVAGGDMILVANGSFDTTLNDVSGVLQSNSIQAVESRREDANGCRQVTLIVYADAAQERRLRDGLVNLSQANNPRWAPKDGDGCNFAETSGGAYTSSESNVIREASKAATAPASRRAGLEEGHLDGRAATKDHLADYSFGIKPAPTTKAGYGYDAYKDGRFRAATPLPAAAPSVATSLTSSVRAERVEVVMRNVTSGMNTWTGLTGNQDLRGEQNPASQRNPAALSRANSDAQSQAQAWTITIRAKSDAYGVIAPPPSGARLDIAPSKSPSAAPAGRLAVGAALAPAPLTAAAAPMAATAPATATTPATATAPATAPATRSKPE
jgi:hypothetical protein